MVRSLQERLAHVTEKLALTRKRFDAELEYARKEARREAEESLADAAADAASDAVAEVESRAKYAVEAAERRAENRVRVAASRQQRFRRLTQPHAASGQGA